MNTSINWIKDLVPGIKEVGDQEFRDAMTMSGTKVEEFNRLNKNLEKIVVGQIKSVEKHQDSDHLVICQVEVGADAPVQIVTGAPNIPVGSSGQKVPVVLDGGKVAGGHDGSALPADGIKIKKGKLRGVESDGMMCSIEELGADREFYPDAPENGIYILPDSAEVGEDAVHFLGLDDCIFEYEITNNRVDCYSVLGIAREAAATFNKPFCPPVVTETGDDDDVNKYISVSVEDELCSRYTARVVKNIRIAPSPLWMQHRLMSQGIRPINNIVDITNYVMAEYGQPMHAYDYDRIAGHKIVVRRAKDGETFQTLDEQERKLDSDILMICDGEKEIGLAGIMGGENSKITDDVKTMLFEAATFDGTNIRKTTKRIGLRTDASGNFEKGLDPELALEAMNRACQLIEELDAGDVCGGVIDYYPNKKEQVKIPFEPDKYNRLLGTDISAEQQLAYFKNIEVGYDKDTNMLLIPSFRQDLKCDADIAEEVARFFGYENIPTSLPHGSTTMGGVSFAQRVIDTASETAEFLGFSQAMTYSFESPKVFDKLRIAADDDIRTTVKILNPLGEDFSVMRTLPINGMLTSLSTNYNRRNKDVRLYEMAKVYIPDPEDPACNDKLPDERVEFTLGFYGEGDFFDMKGVVEEFFTKVGLFDKITYDPNAGKNFLHPGRQANVIYDGKVCGYLGEVHPEVADNYSLGDRTYLAVIDLPVINEMAVFDRKYTGIANFPATTRDISMVVPKNILVGQIEDVIAKNGGSNLESYKLFDIYEGAQIKEGFKSVAYNIVFRAKDRTLEEKDVTGAMDKILEGLTKIGIELRK